MVVAGGRVIFLWGALGAWLLASARVPMGAHSHVHMISTNWTLSYQYIILTILLKEILSNLF